MTLILFRDQAYLKVFLVSRVLLQFSQKTVHLVDPWSFSNKEMPYFFSFVFGADPIDDLLDINDTVPFDFRLQLGERKPKFLILLSQVICKLPMNFALQGNEAVDDGDVAVQRPKLFQGNRANLCQQ